MEIHSIKAQLVALAGALIPVLVVTAAYTQNVLSTQIEQDNRVLATQEQMRRQIDDLGQALQTLEFHIFQATLTLDEGQYRGARSALRELQQRGAALVAGTGQDDSEAPYAEHAVQLQTVLPKLAKDVEYLLKLAADAQQRYPAMPYMTNELSPDNDAFLGAATIALQEARQMQDEGGDMTSILDLFQELRFARAQQTQLFRMFVANRSGAFGQPRQAMSRAEQGVDTYVSRTRELLKRLGTLDDEGKLGLQQSAALMVMDDAQTRYTKTMRLVMDLYRSDNWRTDLSFLRLHLRPRLDAVWGVISRYKAKLDSQGTALLLESERTSTLFSRLVGVFSAVIALLILAAIITFEYGLRRPLVRVSSAMEAAASGSSAAVLPVARNTEVQQLVETFGSMQQQVRSRQAQLMASERRFRALVNNAADALLVFNRQGQILDANRHSEASLGYSHDELLGMNLENVLQQCSLGGVAGIWTDVSAAGATTCEGLCRRRDGTSYPAEASVGLFEWDGTEQMLALVRNVSARKRLERQVLQSEKMASIGQLSAGVAHEINNPVGFVHSNLGTMRQYADTLLDLLREYERLETLLPTDDPRVVQLREKKADADLEFLRDDIPQLLDESMDGAQRVKRIVQDLKDFSRADTGKWELADLHHCLNSTLNIVQNEVKYKAELIKEYGELPLVECMPAQLEQVFMNLFVNAAQAIEGRGTICVRSMGCDRGVAIEVADDGPGIAPDVLPHLFDPFFTTKAVGEGTGLGLSVSYGIVERHGGKLEVESELGGGTVFRIWLPLSQAAPV